MIRNLFNQFKFTEKALDASWLRNEVIAHNIANADTPGYKRKAVSFESCISEMNGGVFMARKTRGGHMDFPGHLDGAKIETDHSELSTRLDGNNVDIEYEMAQLAKNNIRYDTLVKTLNTRLKRLQSAISEGRK